MQIELSNCRKSLQAAISEPSPIEILVYGGEGGFDRRGARVTDSAGLVSLLAELDAEGSLPSSDRH